MQAVRTFFSSFALPGCVMVFGLAAVLGPILHLEPFYTWFFVLAWWSYILGAETFLAARGRSVLFENPRRYLFLAYLSLCFWLVFEAFNFRLANWQYLIVPRSILLRWTGYAVAFATVLPGLMVTKNLLQEFGLHRRRPTVKLRSARALYLPCVILGILFLALPLIWPRYFFPLVWGGFVLLLEPILHRYRQPSFLAQLENGDWREVLLYLYAGAVCGLLWEFWNFWAGAKWAYTIPFVGFLKVFEMPVLGFFGFPPFALECVVMMHFVYLIKSILERRLGARQRHRVYRVLFWICLVLILAVFAGIDRYTVAVYRTY